VPPPSDGAGRTVPISGRSHVLCAGQCVRAGWRPHRLRLFAPLQLDVRLCRAGEKPDRIRLLRYGIAFRETIEDARGLENDSGFTGNVFWTTNSNGFTVRPVGEVARYLIDEQALFGELTGTYTPQLLKHETVDGVDTAVLRLTSSVPFPMDVYIDPATGAFKRAVIDPGGKYEQVVNGLQYTEVQGKRFISAWRYRNSKWLHHYDKVEVNPEIVPIRCVPHRRLRRGPSARGRFPSNSPRTRFRVSTSSSR